MDIEDVKGFFLLNGFEVETINSSIDIYTYQKSYRFNNLKNNTEFWLYKVGSLDSLYNYEFHPGSFYPQTEIKKLKSLDYSPFLILRVGRKLNDNSQKIMAVIASISPNFELKNGKIIGRTLDGKEFPLFMNECEFLNYCRSRSN